MYAVAFDLVVADTEKYHPKGVTQAYTEIGQQSLKRTFTSIAEEVGIIFCHEVMREEFVMKVRAQQNLA